MGNCTKRSTKSPWAHHLGHCSPMFSWDPLKKLLSVKVKCLNSTRDTLMIRLPLCWTQHQRLLSFRSWTTATLQLISPRKVYWVILNEYKKIGFGFRMLSVAANYTLQDVHTIDLHLSVLPQILHLQICQQIVAAGFPVSLFPTLLDHVMSFFGCCTELLDISVGAIHTK